jgi:hypothetical protein
MSLGPEVIMEGCGVKGTNLGESIATLPLMLLHLSEQMYDQVGAVSEKPKYQKRLDIFRREVNLRTLSIHNLRPGMFRSAVWPDPTFSI